MNVFKRYWKGGYSLALSFWVFTLLLTFLIGFAVSQLVKATFATEPSPAAQFILIVGLDAVLLAIFVWQFVGLWRSARFARAARREKGKWAIWANLACATVVLIACFKIFGLTMFERPVVVELFKVAFRGDPDIIPYGMRFMRGGTELHIEGGFKHGLTAAFIAATKDKPQLRVVHFSSPGGRSREGLKLYEEIKRRGLDTYASKMCASSCTLAFSGGKQRWIVDRPVIGLHNESLAGRPNDNIDVNTVWNIFTRAGCQADFIHHVLATPPSSLWTPKPSELLKAHFVTGIASPDRFAASDLGLHPTTQSIARWARTAPWVKLWADSPQKDSFKAYVEKARLGYENGASLQARYTIQRKMYAQAVRRELATQKDATIEAYLALMIEVYKALQVKDPVACYRYDRDEIAGSDIEPIVGPPLRKRRSDLLDAIFKEGGKVPPPPRSVSDALQARLAQKLAEALPADDHALLDTTQTDAAKQAGVCRAKIGLLRAVSAFGPTDGPAAMRTLLRGDALPQGVSAR